MKKTLKEQKGVALLTAVLVMLMLTVIVMGFAMESGTDIDVGRAYLEKIKTFYIAQAGMNRARAAISLEETGWDVDAGINETEAFGSGQFAVTASANATEVNITSTATIDIRTERVVEELGIVRAQGGSVIVESSSEAGADINDNVADYGGGGETNSGFEYGYGNVWHSTGDNGEWIEIDFGGSKSFDRMLIVNATDCDIQGWTVEVWNDGTGAYETQVDFMISEVIQTTFFSNGAADAPANPGLASGAYVKKGTPEYWSVVNFMKGTSDPNCDDLTGTSNGASDNCVPVYNPGVQTTSKVKLTANYTNCAGPTTPTGLDWIQFVMNGSVTTSDYKTFFLNGTDILEGGGGGGESPILPVSANFTER